MVMPERHTAGDQRRLALEIDEALVRMISDQNSTIAALERRAGNDGMAVLTARIVDPFCNGFQPWTAVFVRGAARPECIFSIFAAG